LYVSEDGNYVLGGSLSGSDMIFGFRAPTGTSSNAMLSGTYFVAGMEDTLSSNDLVAFYGSINTNGNGNLIWHQRFDYVVEEDTYDYTVDTPVNIQADGSYFDGQNYTYLAGANGAALMAIGSSQQVSLIVGIHAPSVTPSSTVWIDPVGITNAANFTPITNSFAPGELVSLYGNFGVSVKANETLPIPTTLNEVQVLVNGQPAPVMLVGPNQINILTPYELAGEYFATFQAVVNETKSNAVTVYVGNTAPGIYTLTENGIGLGAILHSNYTEVTDSSPAKPGETVLLFMNGLGTVTPQVGDGAAASTTDLSYCNEFGIFADLNDGVDADASTNVQFAGLAPGFAGLYQVNFTLPESGLRDGNVAVVFYTEEAISEMAKINIAGFSTEPAAQISALFPPQPVAAPRVTRGRDERSRRRALPPRPVMKR
jgi:uncharacterized protein (TIGR03437 family)